MDLALFDFDGTIIRADAYTKFLFYSTSKKRLVTGVTLALPFIILYKFRLLPASVLRTILTRIAFWNRNVESVSRIARQFASEFLPTVAKETALARIAWHKSRGDVVYVVSASLNTYLEYWCKDNDVQLVCSEMALTGSRLTGGYVAGDCSGKNKVKMLQNVIDVSNFRKVYAYSDTHEDLPMLSLAQERYLRWNKMEDLLPES